MFRVISLNANGIRAAARKGFFEWMDKQSPDIVCIQETKAQIYQLTDSCFTPAGYYCFYEDAIKKGYSGVAIYSRQEPDNVIRGFGEQEFDDEGRYLEIRLGKLRWYQYICRPDLTVKNGKRRSSASSMYSRRTYRSYKSENQNTYYVETGILLTRKSI